MIEKTIAKKIGKAIFDYKMIQEGDRILIAVSGGKDSITLFKDLVSRRPSFPLKYEIEAAFIQTDFANSIETSYIENLFKNAKVPYHIYPVSVVKRLKKGRKMNCYWCSTQRRLELMRLAEQQNCNKIALGHHLDDIGETLLMNIMLKGEIGGMLPLVKYIKYPCTIIRPLAYVRESEIIQYAEEADFMRMTCSCGYGSKSKRREIRELIDNLAKHNPNIRENLLKSMGNVDMDYLIGYKTSTLHISPNKSK